MKPPLARFCRLWEPTQRFPAGTFEHIPLPGLADALNQANISLVAQDASVRVGLTGVDAALRATTGSVVLLSGNGRPRAASLLPPIHIAVVAASQIVPDLESWWAVQKAAGLAQARRRQQPGFHYGY